ncbi:MAG: 2-C-methyl-D-erythritol 4-phosphate cytidylyltransferase [Gemmatimonadetes bacterium]|nr:2-C-methyl-D-erythritol 4-phosphate cytidylyltransferase [Gemmatimonadota bacterium]NNM05661.1 2-C-methyl-D-erythritol 4-phosphate cytidylyltransferase [Gemmatimonadota bacterium]
MRPILGVAIPAAGGGVRMGGARKPFLELAGEPLLLHSLRPFLEHPQLGSVVIALGAQDHGSPPSWLKELDPRVRLVLGGASRGESVWCALQALPTSVDLVAVHDAARPLMDRSIIDRCLEAVGPTRGAVAGWPAVDTLKTVEPDNTVSETLTRARIWHAQTPQIFPRDLLFRAYESAMSVGISDTDDAALVERLGGEVRMVPGSPENLKVTRPEDLPLAEHYLRQRGR